MKLQFSKLDNYIIAIVTLLLVLLIVYAQLFKLAPLKTDLKTKQQTLKAEQKLLDTVVKQNDDSKNKVAENTRELQKKVPVKPLQEQLILDFERAETVSGNQIKSMGFSMDGAVSVQPQQPSAQAGSGGQNTTAQTHSIQGAANKGTDSQASTNQADTGQADAQSVSAVPGLKKLTVQLSVDSPNYEQFEKFVETLESLKRIVVVEAINYSGGHEVTSVQQEEQKLSFLLTVSAFYMPDLADLQADVPKIDAEAPAEKTNPLSQFPTTVQTQP
ncbi:hypothetical protein [Neobacillus sp. 114]|uniref:hypothetical protein n=1 Tax=Neobacillus sp. 114 TaxID=3048535 RepID=UPI0024C27068|nr:hypothetical protein [Neobacillus sp. 114]